MDRFIALCCVVSAVALASLSIGGCVVLPAPDPDEDDAPDGDDDTGDGEGDGITYCADLGGIEITLDGAFEVRYCFDSWTEEGVPLTIDGTPQCNNGNCGGADGSWDPGNVWTFGSAIVGDLSQLDCQVTEVQVDVTDYTGIDAATLTVFDADGDPLDLVANTAIGQPETLTAGLGDDTPISSFAAGGCETVFHTIRLY